MSSISVNLSIPLCVGSGVMDWFCHFCSVHSMLTWQGAGRLWGKVIVAPALTLMYSLPWDPSHPGNVVSPSESWTLCAKTTRWLVRCAITGQDFEVKAGLSIQLTEEQLAVYGDVEIKA